MKNLSRRCFLKTTAAIAAPVVIGVPLPARAKVSASERVTVGLIGCGGRGNEVLNGFLAQPGAQVIAVCDVHKLHYRDRDWGKGEPLGREALQKSIEKHYGAEKGSGTYKGCAAYNDYRELIAREDIDAVIVATPDHWHAPIAVEAMRKGKDVYCEKPLTRYFAEGQIIVREAARKKCVFQVGSQQRSEAKFRHGVELVRNGHIGKIKRVEVGLPRGYKSLMGDPAVTNPPEGLDYERWCGPAQVLPYMRARHHRWWRGHRAYGGGSLMDFIGHHNDIAHWGLDLENSGPELVQAVGWTFLKTDLYNTPMDYEIRCEYPGKIEVVIGSEIETGVKWIGETGWVRAARGNLEASDDRWTEQGFDRGPWKAYFSEDHVQNFLDCVKSRKACIAPPEAGHRSITPGHLAFMSNDLGRPIKWDPKTEQIQGDAEAQSRLMAMNHRKPWEIG